MKWNVRDFIVELKIYMIEQSYIFITLIARLLQNSAMIYLQHPIRGMHWLQLVPVQPLLHLISVYKNW